MTFDDFQREALRTSSAPFPERERPLVQCLGLCGEAGEVADLIKKAAWHGKPMDLDRLASEMGDTLWYLAALASTCDVDLEEIAHHNVDKLRARYPDGFCADGGHRA